MPQIDYRANLSAAIFPLSLSQAGRSVIIPGPDNNYDRRVDPEGEQKDAGIPQAIYLENVIPTANGYQSVGKNTLLGVGAPTGIAYIVNQFPVKEPSGNGTVWTGTLVYTTSPNTYLFSIIGTGLWTPVTFVGTAAYPDFNPRITFAIVRGVCYVLISGSAATHLYTAEVSGLTLTLTNVSASVTHITLNNIVGICGAYNYLLAFSADGDTYWSSTTTPTDFTPSLVTGAGSTTPTGLYGNFNYAYATSFGFYMFSRVGAVAATYTGNSRFPWKFTVVPSTNIIESAATQDPNTRRVLVYDAAYNLYFLENLEVTPVAPELSAYLRGNRKDYTYNYSTHTLTEFQPQSTIKSKLYCFYDRYICVSVGGFTSGGTAKYKILLVYDMMFNRYGRCVHDHTDVLAVNDLYTSELTFAVFDASTGNACNFNLSTHNTTSGMSNIVTSESILILGKFQYVRSRRLELQEVDFDGQFGSVTARVYTANDGTTLSAGLPMSVISSSVDSLQCSSRAEGQNICIGLQGKFSLDSMQLTFSLGGGR